MKHGTVALLSLLLAVGCQSKDKDSEAGKTKPSKSKPSKTEPTKKRGLSAEDWQGDLKFLASELPKRHINLFHATSKKDFDAAVAALDAKLPSLNSYQRIAELTRLVAMFQEGHTALVRPKVQYLMLGLYTFSDGVFVRAAPRGHGWAVGRQLTHVDGTPVDQVIAKLTPLIARDNNMQVKNLMRNYLIDATLLFGLGITKRKDRAVYTLAAKDAKPRDLTVALGQRLQNPPMPKRMPLSRQRNNLNYWNKYLADSRTLYVQYNRCANAAYLTFKRFADGLLARLDKKDVARLVIDLRHNGGGDSRIINPLLEGLSKRPAATKKGKLYVIIGRGTFSSAVLNTLALKHKHNAILVGEPSGGKPSHYGEVKKFRLPKSKLQIQYSTKYFKHEGMPGPSIIPDIAVTESHVDYQAGTDPAMAAILAKGAKKAK